MDGGWVRARYLVLEVRHLGGNDAGFGQAVVERAGDLVQGVSAAVADPYPAPLGGARVGERVALGGVRVCADRQLVGHVVVGDDELHAVVEGL
jgi:hypothetical protein